MIDKDKMNAVERDLVEGLEGFLEDLKQDAPIRERYTCRRLVLNLEPSRYDPGQVKATRTLLKVSQSLFAQFLGVSTSTVSGWEQGKPVNNMACRFMDEIQVNPDYWRKRLIDSVDVKSSSVPS